MSKVGKWEIPKGTYNDSELWEEAPKQDDEEAMKAWWVEDVRTHGWAAFNTSVSRMTWQAACAYKDKRIAEAERLIRETVIPYIDPVDTDILNPVLAFLGESEVSDE